MLLEAEALVANQSLLPELGDAASRYWQASSHPQNIADIKNSTVETFRGKPALLAGFTGLLVLEAIELSPINETILVEVARDHFTTTNGEDILGAAARVGAITMALETTIGLGSALYLHKAKDTVKIIHDRYLKKFEDSVTQGDDLKTESGVEAEKRIGLGFAQKTKETAKKAAKPIVDAGKVAGVAILAGAGGATVLDNVADEDPSLEKSAKYAILAAGSISLYNMAIATGVMVGTKSNIPALKEACEWLIETVKNPRVVFLALAGAFGIARFKEQRKMYNKLVREGRIEG